MGLRGCPQQRVQPKNSWQSKATAGLSMCQISESVVDTVEYFHSRFYIQTQVHTILATDKKGPFSCLHIFYHNLAWSCQ